MPALAQLLQVKLLMAIKEWLLAMLESMGVSELEQDRQNQ